RRAQVLHRRRDLSLIDIRGNVDTRLRKLDEQGLDALILAEAGLRRVGRGAALTEKLHPPWMLPPGGPGAPGPGGPPGRAATRALLGALDHPATHQAVLAERAMLRGLGGGCQVPIGAAATVRGGRLALRGVVLPPDGSRRVAAEAEGDAADAEAVGSRLAE